MKKDDGKAHAGMELLNGVTALAERAERDGNVTRVFFAGRSSKGGIIPVSDLLVVFVKPGDRRREYTRFTKEWPVKFEPAGKIMKSPRYLCSAIAGVLDGVFYVGTDEVRWSPVKPGESREPVAAGSDGCACGCTRHDLHERDIRKVGALNPVRMVRHRLLFMLGRSSYDPKVCGAELEIQDQLEFPRFLVSVNPPYQKFRIRGDEPDALARAKRVLACFARGEGMSDESGASMLLQVLKRANEGIWLDERYSGEHAPFTGIFRLDPATGDILGRQSVPVGVTKDEGPAEERGEDTFSAARPGAVVDRFVMSDEEDGGDGGGKVDESRYQSKVRRYPDFSDAVNAELDRLFEGTHHVQFEPTVAKEWAVVRQGQPLRLPKATPRKHWAPAEIAEHPKFKGLALLAALATVETRGRLTYADADLVKGSAAWVDLDAAPRVQLVAGSAGLRHFGNGVRADLSRLDIEAHIRSTRASRQRI